MLQGSDLSGKHSHYIDIDTFGYSLQGSLVSISPRLYELEVCVSASSLFVRKFQQPEHFVTLESAFASVLHQPVRLLISVLNSADRSPL